MLKNLLLFIAFISAGISATKGQPVLSYSAVINSGLSSSIDVVPVHDGTGRIFIVQQNGVIKVYGSNYTLLNSNFLTINSNISVSGEQGLLSLAFHPNYVTNRYFFVYYTNAAGGINIDRFQTSAANANAVDADTRTSIMVIDKPVAQTNHNGGKLNFGPDGDLYFALGDGGGEGDPRNFGQRGDSLWGKLVRINVDNFTTSPYYTIPADNPYVSSGSILHPIFASGLRNPFRWSFDKANGNIWIADVGQDAWEEVNTLTPALANGANYGWRCYEATHSYNTASCLPANSYGQPVFEYPHNGTTGGFAVTGGYVYRGSVYPAMYGYYICADYVSGNVWTINAASHAATLQATKLSNVVSFGELENGELLALSLSGTLYTVGTSSVLPLKLLQWSGTAFDNYNQLSWQTAEEVNVKQFDVEYSADGISFTNAGTILAKNLPNSAYTFRHYIQSNVSYYRLKTTNDNGKVEYTAIIALKNNSQKREHVIYSYNGNTKQIWLNIPANEKADFQLFSFNGQKVLQVSNYQNNAIIDLQKIPAGIYIGKIILTNRIVSEKVLVQ